MLPTVEGINCIQYKNVVYVPAKSVLSFEKKKHNYYICPIVMCTRSIKYMLSNDLIDICKLNTELQKNKKSKIIKNKKVLNLHNSLIHKMDILIEERNFVYELNGNLYKLSEEIIEIVLNDLIMNGENQNLKFFQDTKVKETTSILKKYFGVTIAEYVMSLTNNISKLYEVKNFKEEKIEELYLKNKSFLDRFQKYRLDVLIKN